MKSKVSGARASKGSRRSRERVRASSTGESQSLLSAALFGTGIGICVAIILSIVCTAIALGAQDPDKLIAPLGTAAIIISHFIGGFAASRKKRAAIPVGVTVGAMIAAFFFIISLMLPKSLSSGMAFTVSLLIRLSMIIVSLLGALMGVNMGMKKRRR